MTATLRASEVAAALGCDPYRSPIALWAEHTGLVEPKEAGEAARWGTLLQPVIAAEVEARGYQVMPAPADELRVGHLTGHPDGYYGNGNGSRGVLEIKTASLRLASSWYDGEAPVGYVLQATAYMRLTGLDHALLACLIGGQRLALVTVPLDQKLVEVMEEREAEFLDYVERQTPPPPDGSEATDDVLKRLYSTANGEIVHLTAELAEVAREIPKLKAAAKAAEAQIAEREQRLKLALGESPVGWYDGDALVRWPVVSASRLSQSRVKAEYPDTYAACLESSSYRRFTVKS